MFVSHTHSRSQRGETSRAVLAKAEADARAAKSSAAVGRGKKSRVHEQIIPIKDIWLYPLHKNFRSVLVRS